MKLTKECSPASPSPMPRRDIFYLYFLDSYHHRRPIQITRSVAHQSIHIRGRLRP
eukprot:UN01515